MKVYGSSNHLTFKTDVDLASSPDLTDVFQFNVFKLPYPHHAEPFKIYSESLNPNIRSFDKESFADPDETIDLSQVINDMVNNAFAVLKKHLANKEMIEADGEADPTPEPIAVQPEPFPMHALRLSIYEIPSR